MWLATLIIGLIIGWFARTLVDLIRQVLQKINLVSVAIEAQDEEEAGISRPGIVTTSGGIKKLKPVSQSEDNESPIVRAPSPRQVALEEEANRKRPRTL